MHPEDDSQTTLSKWPFIVGDVLLVATALAIGILGNWQLTNLQVATCVVAVALGAGLFVLPYIVEFQVRIREEKEDRAADLRILEKHILSAEQAQGTMEKRIRALESEASGDGQPNAALLELADQKIARLEAACAEQDEAIQALRKTLDELPREAPAAFDPKVLKPIEARLQALESRPEPVIPADPTPKKKDEAKKDAAPKDIPKPQAQVSQIERPKRAARERHGPEESRLLKRAISDKSHTSSAAVSRIIGTKEKETKKHPEPEAKDAAPEMKDKAAAVEDSKEKEPVQKEPEAASPKPEPSVDSEVANEAPPQEKHEVSLSAEATSPILEEAATGEEEERAIETSAKATEPKTEPKLEKEPEAEEAAKKEVSNSDEKEKASTEPSKAEEGEDLLFDNEKITTTVIRTKAKKNDAVLTASVFIGIGNKPYLRGSGGGLNWDSGVVMEFQEIGKWRWVAPSDLEGELELQIYRNDEDPDTSGKYKLQPGQKLDVTPVF